MAALVAAYESTPDFTLPLATADKLSETLHDAEGSARVYLAQATCPIWSDPLCLHGHEGR
jgi:hypothetical protein